MLKILFWNLKNRALNKEVVGLARENDVDILILAEDKVAPVTRLMDLNKERTTYFITPTSCARLNIFSAFSPHFVKAKRESKYFSLQEISLPAHEPFLLLALHWKSLMWRREASQAYSLAGLARMIRDIENAVGHSRTIVTGDFNSDPFGEGMISSNGMHSVMCRSVASRGQRTVSPWDPSPFFYNPTWGLFGDEGNGPPGTYYRSSAEENCHFWHIFDQVMIRPEMISYLPSRSVEIPTVADGISLIDSKGFPKASDHLPILFSINIPKNIL